MSECKHAINKYLDKSLGSTIMMISPIIYYPLIFLSLQSSATPFPPPRSLIFMATAMLCCVEPLTIQYTIAVGIW